MSNEETKNITTDQKKRPFLKIIFLLLVIVSIGYLGYYQFARTMRSSSQLEEKVQQTEDLISKIENTSKTQQETLQTLSDEFAQFKQTMSTALQNRPALKAQLLIEEVRYLVKLAEFNLQYRHSIPETIALLKLADQEIRDETDNQFVEMRKAIAEDIVDLQAIPVVDVTGIYMRLLALNGKVDELPLMTKPTLTTEPSQATVNEEELSWWKKGLHQTWESLRHLVVVRYNTSGKVPLITPEQQSYLYQNWHAMFLHAMSALLQGQSEIYRASLQQIEQWTKEYCVTSSSVTNAFLSEVTQLQDINIKQEIPKLSRSLQVVDTLKVS